MNSDGTGLRRLSHTTAASLLAALPEEAQVKQRQDWIRRTMLTATAALVIPGVAADISVATARLSPFGGHS
jgi:hypothetical protein